MTQYQIYQKIQENNALIKKSVQSDTFVLNEAVVKLLDENRALQKKCHHEFEDKTCKWCSFNK